MLRKQPLSKGTLSTVKKDDSSRKKDVVGSTLVDILFPLSILIVLILLSPIIYLLYTRLGLGSHFIEQNYFYDMNPLANRDSIEIVAKLPMPPGNIAVSSTGRIFFNFHPEYLPKVIKIAELASLDSFSAFPNEEFQSKIATCLSMRIDRQDRLWLLDFGFHGLKKTPTLYAFDLKQEDKLVKEYVFPASVAGLGSMLNDFHVDPAGEYIYLVDTGIVSLTPSLVVYSVLEDRSFRILSGHSSMYGGSTFLNISGSIISFGPLGLSIHADSIALDYTGDILYYGALTSPQLYSIATKHLVHYVRTMIANSAEQSTLDQGIIQHVKLVSNNKPVTDGILIDKENNMWMTAIEHSAIAVATLPTNNKHNQDSTTTTSIQIRKVVQDTQLLRWPDGLSLGPDSDSLYITNSALHLPFTRVQNITAHAPFHILKLPIGLFSRS